MQQPLGGRVWGFPEDALEINHLLIRKLKIISADNVCDARSWSPRKVEPGVQIHCFVLTSAFVFSVGSFLRVVTFAVQE